MTADVVNLRRVRKAKARVDKERLAVETRAAFGRPKAEKEKTTAERSRVLRVLEGHRRKDT